MHKTLSFAALHFSIAFAITWLMTGNVLLGGAVALIEPAVNTLAFHWHERIWQTRSKTGLPAAGGLATLS